MVRSATVHKRQQFTDVFQREVRTVLRRQSRDRPLSPRSGAHRNPECAAPTGHVDLERWVVSHHDQVSRLDAETAAGEAQRLRRWLAEHSRTLAGDIGDGGTDHAR